MKIILLYIMLVGPLSLIGQNCNGNLNVTIPGSTTGDTLQVNYSTVDIYCPDDESGSIDLMVGGGNPEYNYTWSHDGNTNEDQYTLGPGSYTVTVTDDADCVNVEVINIIVMDPVGGNLDLIDVDACGYCNLEDGNQTFFYFDNMFIANIEDLVENEDLGPTTVCTDIIDGIRYCEEEPCLPRSWTVDTGDSPAQLTLYFTDAEFQELIDASACASIADCIMNGDLCITGYTGGLQNCNDFDAETVFSLANGDFDITQDDPMSGVWSISFTINNSLIQSASTGSTSYYLHTCKFNGNTIPLNLLFFEAEAVNDINQLKWRTSNEIGFSHFEIERSADAISFSKIGNVDTGTQSGLQKDYVFDDELPISGFNYYRLKMVDQDGSYYYSHITLVNRYQDGLINIFPNPFIENLNINVNIESNKSIKLYLYNANNQLVYSDVLNTDRSNQTTTLNLANLTADIYQIILVDFETGNIINHEKLVKFKY